MEEKKAEPAPKDAASHDYVHKDMVIKVLADFLLHDMQRSEAMKVLELLKSFMNGGKMPFMTLPKTPERRARTIMRMLNKLHCKNRVAMLIEEAKKIHL